MRHFSRRYFAKLFVVPLAASIVRIAKSDESEPKSSWNFYGTLHPATFTNYVKPAQGLYLQSKGNQGLGVAVIFVQLASDDNTNADIRYRIMDKDGNMGQWHHKGSKTCENNDSVLFKTTFSFTKDVAVTTLPSGEVQITGYDANNHNNSVTCMSTKNQYGDDDTTWDH